MEPGHEDREYYFPCQVPAAQPSASMEPGHEDREYSKKVTHSCSSDQPQWSPVMKTGNTTSPARSSRRSARLNGARS